MKRLLLPALLVASNLYSQSAPGGVTNNLELWLSATIGTSCTTNGCAITTWTDNSSNAYVATSADEPSYVETEANYNPTISFNGNNNHFRISGGIFPTTTAWNDFVYYGVVKKEANNGDIEALCSEALSGGFLRVYGSTTQDKVRMDYPTNSQDIRVSFANITQETTIWTFGHIHSGTPLYGVSSYGQKDGKHIKTGDGTANGKLSNGDFFIGSLQNPNNRNYDGSISETILLSGSPTVSEHLRIMTYLGIKYSITISNDMDGDGNTGESIGGFNEGDYVMSSGNIIWSHTNSPRHHNDIIGIMRDNNSNLLQKQSKSNDDSLKLYVGSLTTSNALNTGTITNNESSILIGHDGGRLSREHSADIPPGIFSRFGRSWKVTNSNFVDDFGIEIEWDSIGTFNISDIRLLVDDDGDFSDATIYAAGDNGLTITSGSIIVEGISTAHIPANSTRFITIASVSPTTPLPVELIAFDTKKNVDNSIDLKWVTASEINSSHFEIQRSSTNGEFKTIHSVTAAGNSTTPINYEWTDLSPLDGLSYYRLKQVDHDGNYEYSEISAIYSKTDWEFTIYPNPTAANGEININFGNRWTNLEANIVVYDLSGKIQFKRSITPEELKSQVPVKLSHQLRAGTYLVGITSSSGNHWVRMIVE
jgi:hypothetical protein